MTPKTFRLLQILLFGGLGAGQLVCAAVLQRYGREVHPVLISAAAFYPPLLITLIACRRSWTDVLCVAIVFVGLAAALDAFAFPFGSVALIAVHLLWTCSTLVSVLRETIPPTP